MTAVEAYSVEMMKLIFPMTFTGSILSVFLFMLRPIVRDRLPKSFQYYMWFPVVIALILPISKFVEIPISNHPLMSVRPVYDIVQRVSDTVSETPINFALTPQNENGQTIRQVTDFPNAAVIICGFWQLGMLLVLYFHMICYASYIRRLRRRNRSADRWETEVLNDLSERKTLRLYKNPIVETPILIGFFHPAVILPDKEYEDIKLRNILLHEMTHMKRHDILVKWLLILVGAIHWFNPFVYFVRREMNKACELACDESVIKKFDINEMQQYGDTLIAVAADSIRKMPLSITMFEDKKNLKERLGAIMKHKKYANKTVITASVILVAIVCTVLGFSTLRSIENKHNYADNYPLPQDQKNIKAIELRSALRDYDEKNIAEAYVFLSDSDGEITNAYITIICYEENPDSEMQSKIKSLASEELGLDVQNIYVDYMDYESFTSNERVSK